MSKRISWILVLTGLSVFPLMAYAQQASLVLQDTIITGVASFAAGSSITAGPNLTIASGGDVTLRTNGSIYFRNGVVIVLGGMLRTISDTTISDVRTSGSRTLPVAFALNQNYPNPFNPTTTLSFDLPLAAHVELTVYDMLGREVARIVNEMLPAGTYVRTFDAGGLASGVYIYRLRAKAYSSARRMVLLK